VNIFYLKLFNYKCQLLMVRASTKWIIPRSQMHHTQKPRAEFVEPEVGQRTIFSLDDVVDFQERVVVVVQ